MKLLLTFTVAIFLAAGTNEAAEPFTFAKAPADGIYVYPPSPLYSRAFTLANGRFTSQVSADTPGDTAGKPPLEKAKESGRFLVDGSRVIFLGDNPAYAEILYHCTIDDVAVLVNQIALRELYYEQRIAQGECFILRTNPEQDYYKWWDKLSKAHPTFAKIVKPHS